MVGVLGLEPRISCSQSMRPNQLGHTPQYHCNLYQNKVIVKKIIVYYSHMIIHKKTWKDYFEKVLAGGKKFDLRLADFEVKEGDTLVLEEWDPIAKKYTGRKIGKKVSYVLKTKDLKFWSEEETNKYGYQVIQFE